jgi:hypothetical protein
VQGGPGRVDTGQPEPAEQFPDRARRVGRGQTRRYGGQPLPGLGSAGGVAQQPPVAQFDVDAAVLGEIGGDGRPIHRRRVSECRQWSGAVDAGRYPGADADAEGAVDGYP